MEQGSNWYVYMVLCADGTLYTGCARNLEKRIAVHNSGLGARYTRARLPVKLVYSEPAVDRSQALKREYALKQLSAQEKKKLIL